VQGGTERRLMNAVDQSRPRHSGHCVHALPLRPESGLRDVLPFAPCCRSSPLSPREDTR